MIRNKDDEKKLTQVILIEKKKAIWTNGNTGNSISMK